MRLLNMSDSTTVSKILTAVNQTLSSRSNLAADQVSIIDGKSLIDTSSKTSVYKLIERVVGVFYCMTIIVTRIVCFLEALTFLVQFHRL